MVTWTVGVRRADVGLMLTQTRWALGLVIGNTWPVGRIFTAGLAPASDEVSGCLPGGFKPALP